MIEDRHIQWLLERCVPGSCPLEWVVPLPNAEALNCCYVEEPTVEGIAELISTAVSRGLVRLYRSSIRDERQTSLAWPVADPRSGEIALTETGAAKWESLARPRWDCYIDWQSWAGTESLRCVRRDLLEESLQNEPLWSGDEIEPGSVAWSTEEPWQVAPWKQLPHCHVLRYRIRKTHRAPLDLPLWLVEWRWRSREWYDPVIRGESAVAFLTRLNARLGRDIHGNPIAGE